MIKNHVTWKGAGAVGLIVGLYSLWAFASDPQTGAASSGQILAWGVTGATIATALWAAACIAQGYWSDR